MPSAFSTVSLPSVPSLHVQGEGAVDQDDERTGLAARLVLGLARDPGRPWQSGPVGIGRVTRRQDLGSVLVGAGGSEAVHGAGRAELCRTQPLDEVAAADPPGLLRGGQHAIDRSESADDLLGLDRATRHDAVAVEQDLGRGQSPCRGVSVDPRQDRPATDGGRRPRPSGERGSR